MTFEQYLRDNPMPTKNVDNKNYKVVSKMSKNTQRFFTHENMVSDTEMIIPVTIWSNKEQQQKFCDELNNMDVTINNLSEHLEKAMKDNTHKTITIGKLYEENRGIQEKVFELMDYLEKEKGINRQEIKEWWND